MSRLVCAGLFLLLATGCGASLTERLVGHSFDAEVIATSGDDVDRRTAIMTFGSDGVVEIRKTSGGGEKNRYRIDGEAVVFTEMERPKSYQWTPKARGNELRGPVRGLGGAKTRGDETQMVLRPRAD